MHLPAKIEHLNAFILIYIITRDFSRFYRFIEIGTINDLLCIRETVALPSLDCSFGSILLNKYAGNSAAYLFVFVAVHHTRS